MLALGISHLPGRVLHHNLRSNITRLTSVKRAYRAERHEPFSAQDEFSFVQGGFYWADVRSGSQNGLLTIIWYMWVGQALTAEGVARGVRVLHSAGKGLIPLAVAITLSAKRAARAWRSPACSRPCYGCANINRERQKSVSARFPILYFTILARDRRGGEGSEFRRFAQSLTESGNGAQESCQEGYSARRR